MVGIAVVLVASRQVLPSQLAVEPACRAGIAAVLAFEPEGIEGKARWFLAVSWVVQ